MEKNKNGTNHRDGALMRLVRSTIIAVSVSAFLLGLGVAASYAGSGTWILDPINNDWDTAANWSSNMVPGPLDTATFGVSNVTDIVVSAPSGVGTIVFRAGADAYQITAAPGQDLSIENTGITNESGIMQNFVATTDDSGASGSFLIQLEGTTAGSLTTFTTEARTVADGLNAVVQFVAGANAGSATIINNGGIISGVSGGETDFFNTSTAGTANITNKAAVVSGATGGSTFFTFSSSGEDSTITCEGATVSGAEGGITIFQNSSRAANATSVANGGLNGGGGGAIQLEGSSTGGMAHVKVFGNGNLDITAHGAPGVTIGSLEGDGLVFLGTRKLTVGSNSLSTIFSGVVQDTGSLAKIGTATLTLSGANTYTGGTTVSDGGLTVSNTTGSATGTGEVGVNAGTLSGKGIIAGAVTIGTGSGAGAFLAPGQGASKPTTLTIQNALTFKGDATYTYRLNTKKAKADKVVANGVTIESGAQFNFSAVANRKLTAGTVFTAISNTAATPISGTFSNLADGSTFTVGRNSYQVSYSGGDGNDLTLTVVP